MKIYKIKNKYYCVASNTYDYSAFIAAILIKIHAIENSFVFNYSKKIFTELFRYADDLLMNYTLYYKDEYSNFYSYLYQKEMIDKDELSLIYVDESHTILKLNPDLNSYNLTNLLDFDDKYIDLLNEVLEAIFPWNSDKILLPTVPRLLLLYH